VSFNDFQFGNTLLIWRFDRCLDKLAEFMTPILKGVKDMTGFNWILVGGGPSPALNGEISTVQ
jgi:hypothetical protein